VIGVYVRFENVLDVEAVCGDVGDDGFVVFVGGGAGGWIVVEDGIENDGLEGGWVGDEVGHC